MRMYKNKYENNAYRNYNNSQINTDENTIQVLKILDIVQVAKFEAKSKNMALQNQIRIVLNEP